MRSHAFHAVAALLLAGLMPLDVSADPPSGQTVCGGRVCLTPPAGWQITQAGEAGAVLRPPDGQGTPIEVVGWDVPPGGEPSAEAAASAEETLLYRTSPYARSSAKDYRTAAGDPALLVTGKVKGPDGKLQDALFAAFVVQKRYYIIGTFAPEGSATAALDGAFGGVLRSLRFEAPSNTVAVKAEPRPSAPLAAPPTIAPAPAPEVAAKPVETPAPVMPEPPAPSVPAAVTPVETPIVTIAPTRKPEPAAAPGTTPTPAVAPTPVPTPQTAAAPATPPPPPMTHYRSAVGFELEHPAGWQAGVVDGHIEVTSPTGDGSNLPAALAAIWPVTAVPAGQDAATVARQLLAKWPVSAGAANLAVRARDEGVVLAGMVGPAGRQRRLVACCQVKGDTGLLTALVCRPESFADDLGALTAILSSFSGGPWWTSSQAERQAVTLWRDPAAKALEGAVPAGWKVRGGVQNYNGSWSLYLDLTSNDARRLSITWQQPLTPPYRDLTTVLRNLGWQEGDKYVANPGEQPLRILSRLSPQDFLTRQWLPNGALRLDSAVIDRLDVRPEAAGLVNGPNAQGLVAALHGTSEAGPRERFCALATADAPGRAGTNCWQVGVLQADAPVGALDEALAVLRAVVSGVQLAPGAPPQAAGPLRQLLQGARQALAVLPPPQEPAATQEVLSVLAPKGKGDLWLLSPEALGGWQMAARCLQRGQKSTDSFPELQPGFWK